MERTRAAGTTWTIVNKSIDSFYSGTTGQITFSTDTFTVDSGRFASAGIVAASENDDFCFKPLNPISYELVGNSLIYVTWVGQARQDPTATLQQEAVITIDSRDKGKLVLVGEGRCGGSGIPRISILTNVNDKKHGNDNDDDDND